MFVTVWIHVLPGFSTDLDRHGIEAKLQGVPALKFTDVTCD